jgi:surface antigen
MPFRAPLALCLTAVALSGVVGAANAAAKVPTSAATSAGAARLPVVRERSPSRAAQAAAAKMWQLYGKGYAANFRNGQCTDLVQRRRPDVVARIMRADYAVWADSRYRARTWEPHSWDATFWDDNAAHAGLRVGATPRVGAVMVVNSANYPASPGHVAIVDAVRADGSVLVTEERAPLLWHVTRRTVSRAALHAADIDFIY